MGILFPADYRVERTFHDLVRKECDVLVIGAGVAGLIASAKCAEVGKKSYCWKSCQKPAAAVSTHSDSDFLEQIWKQKLGFWIRRMIMFVLR